MAVKDIAGKMPIATRGHLNVNAIGVSMATHTVLAIPVSLNKICKSEKGISFRLLKRVDSVYINFDN